MNPNFLQTLRPILPSRRAPGIGRGVWPPPTEMLPVVSMPAVPQPYITFAPALAFMQPRSSSPPTVPPTMPSLPVISANAAAPVSAAPPMTSTSRPPPAPRPPSTHTDQSASQSSLLSRQNWMPPPNVAYIDQPTQPRPDGSRWVTGLLPAYA